MRFHREAPTLLARAEDGALTLGGYLAERGLTALFTDRYLLPTAAAIWSAPVRDMLDYPARIFVRFFANHGLLRVAGQLRWRTVNGGSRRYVEKRTLGTFRYTANVAILHRDRCLMPRRCAVWSSWNYVANQGAIEAPASLTYWMNRLQKLGGAPDIFVSLNPTRPPAPEPTMAHMSYEHPLFDRAALEAQRALPSLQGEGGVFFCGSYAGYGFHEDALAAGLDVAERLGGARRLGSVSGVHRPPVAAAPPLPDLGDFVPLPVPALVPARVTRL